MKKKCDKKYKISGRLKVTEKIWNNFLNILKENNIPVPKFPIWTDWWDSDGKNTTITKYNKKLSDKENKEIIIKNKRIFIINIKIGSIKIENFIKNTIIY